MRGTTAMLALLVSASCAGTPTPARQGDDDAPVPTTEPLAEAPVPTETDDPALAPLVLSLRSRQDAPDITARVRALQDEPAPRPPVQIRIDADALDGLVLQLGSVTADTQLDLTVSGRSDGTVLRDGSVRLVGHDVAVSDLRFVGGPSSGDSLTVTASGTAELTDVAFAGHRARLVPSTRRRGARAHQGALRLQAMGRDAVATMHGLTVVDATVSPAIQIGAQPGGRFDRVELEGAAFASVAAPAVGVGATLQLVLSDVRSDAPEGLVQTDSPAVLVDGRPLPLDADDPRVEAARAALQPND